MNNETRKNVIGELSEALDALDKMIINYPQGGRRVGKSNLHENWSIARGRIINAKFLLQNEQDGVTEAPVDSPQIKLEDFHIGFEYEELIPDSERYLPSGIIWRKRVYCLESPKLHKIKKYIEEGKVRKIWPDNQNKDE